jgi:hypothetical protein
MKASYDHTRREHLVSFKEGELVGITNAVNEVCNGVDIDDREFQTRLGLTREQLRVVLGELQSAINKSENTPNV